MTRRRLDGQPEDNSANGLGVDTMNAYVHSFTQSTGPADVRELSQHYPLLEDRDAAL